MKQKLFTILGVLSLSLLLSSQTLFASYSIPTNDDLFSDDLFGDEALFGEEDTVKAEDKNFGQQLWDLCPCLEESGQKSSHRDLSLA